MENNTVISIQNLIKQFSVRQQKMKVPRPLRALFYSALLFLSCSLPGSIFSVPHSFVMNCKKLSRAKVIFMDVFRVTELIK